MLCRDRDRRRSQCAVGIRNATCDAEPVRQIDAASGSTVVDREHAAATSMPIESHAGASADVALRRSHSRCHRLTTVVRTRVVPDRARAVADGRCPSTCRRVSTTKFDCRADDVARPRALGIDAGVDPRRRRRLRSDRDAVDAVPRGARTSRIALPPGRRVGSSSIESAMRLDWLDPVDGPDSGDAVRASEGDRPPDGARLAEPRSTYLLR